MTIEAGLENIYAFMDGQAVMTLATVNGDGSPRSTPLYFVRAGRELSFTSFAKTVHSRNIARDSRVSAAISLETRDYSKIRGVQVFGEASAIEDPAAAALAAAAMFLKYPSAKAIFDAEALRHAVSSSWYRLTVGRLVYVDNSAGFGHREEYAF